MSTVTNEPTEVQTETGPGQTATLADERQALLDALAAVMQPLAQLAVARGLPFHALEEALKQALVREAAAVHVNVAPHRKVSRVSIVTGINRREVTRLMKPADSDKAPPRWSLSSEVFAHWHADPANLDSDGLPRTLPRLGPAPSFEALVGGVTHDVHPRSLMEELLRLKLAVYDEAADTVSLVREGFVPSGDHTRMLGLLADNVGDHLRAAVDNVLGDGQQHFEQAVFADGLSDRSLTAVRSLIRSEWATLLARMVPRLKKLAESDADLPANLQRRLRIGLYGYDDGQSKNSAPKAAIPQRRRLAHKLPRSGPPSSS